MTRFFSITYSCPLCSWELRADLPISEHIYRNIAVSEIELACPCREHGEGKMKQVPKLTDGQRRQVIAAKLRFDPKRPESWPLSLIDRLMMVEEVMPGELHEEIRKILRSREP